jgi:diguanylate cyclase (GGDEF)-like protein/PAS domain S-box-containing protein
MALFNQDKLFESAFHYAAIGMALVGTDGRFLRVNRSLCDLLGYTDAELLRLTFQDITHPEDLNSDLEQLQKLAYGEIETYRMDKRYFHRDGHEIWARLSVSAVRDEAGKVEFYISQIKDISESKAAEVALRTASARLTALVCNLQAAVLVEDENRRIVLANPTFCEMFGLNVPPDKLVGVDSMVAREKWSGKFNEPEAFIRRAAEVLEKRETVIGDVLGLRDGRFLERDYVPIISHGTYLGHLWSYRDITHRKRMQEQTEQQARLLLQANELLKEQASTDSLTGLANRRALRERLLQEWNRAARANSALCLVMMDLDHFKNYNDDFGHPAGDVVLQKVAALLLEQARDSDLVARYGGEEIAILLPQTDLAGATALAERFRVAVENADWPHRTVTASFGVACAFPVGVENLDARSADTQSEIGITELIVRADAALYQAKQQGRNRVREAAAL